jgi:hypothetical protein
MKRFMSVKLFTLFSFLLILPIAVLAEGTLPEPALYLDFEQCEDGIYIGPGAYGGVACQPGKFGTAGDFDGIDDGVEIDDSPDYHFTDALTLAAWVRPDTISGLNTIVNIGNHPSWNAYDGLIDELRLYDTALTPLQVRDLAGNRPFLYGSMVIWGHWLEMEINSEIANQWNRNSMDKVVEMGGTNFRGNFTWFDLEGEQGVYDWSYADHQIDEAEDRGLEIFAYSGVTPDWALPDDKKGKGHRFPPTDEYIPDFERFFHDLAARYCGRVRYYEFWNEPNGCGWINPDCSNGDEADTYVPWLRRWYSAMKSGCADTVLAIGGLDCNQGTGDNGCADYLEAIYRHGGGDYFDAIAIHPYGVKEPNAGTSVEQAMNWAAIQEVANTLIAHGDGHKKIWLNEYGWNTSDEATKARLVDGVLTELEKPEYNMVFQASYHALTDITQSGKDNWGLCDRDLSTLTLTPRESWRTFCYHVTGEPLCYVSYVSSDVAPGGDGSLEHPFNTISGALASGAKHVYVAAGVYCEDIQVPSDTVLEGDFPEDSSERAMPVIIGQVVMEHSHAVLDGFEIAAPTPGESTGITIGTGNSAMAPSDIVVRNCSVHDWNTGIQVRMGDDVTIEYTIIADNYAGVSKGGHDDLRLDHNTIVHNEKGVLHFWGETPLDLTNNIVAYNSVYGVWCNGWSGVTRDYNVCYENAINYRSGWSDTERFPSLKGPHSFYDDPVFVNPDEDNYYLLSDSPCIGVASDGGNIGALQDVVDLPSIGLWHASNEGCPRIDVWYPQMNFGEEHWYNIRVYDENGNSLGWLSEYHRNQSGCNTYFGGNSQWPNSYYRFHGTKEELRKRGLPRKIKVQFIDESGYPYSKMSGILDLGPIPGALSGRVYRDYGDAPPPIPLPKVIPGPGPKKKPLPGATVTIAGRSDITNETGHYFIGDVPAGTYTATCTHPNYWKLSAQVTISDGRTTAKGWYYEGVVE